MLYDRMMLLHWGQGCPVKTSCGITRPAGCLCCVKECSITYSSLCTMWPIFSRTGYCRVPSWQEDIRRYRCNESHKDTLCGRHEAPAQFPGLNKWDEWMSNPGPVGFLWTAKSFLHPSCRWTAFLYHFSVFEVHLFSSWNTRYPNPNPICRFFRCQRVVIVLRQKLSFFLLSFQVHNFPLKL